MLDRRGAGRRQANGFTSCADDGREASAGGETLQKTSATRLVVCWECCARQDSNTIC